MEILALCRAGFEKEVAAELSELCAQQGVSGYAKAKDATGYVEFVVHSGTAVMALFKQIRFDELVFVRHWFVAAEVVMDLNPADRVNSLLPRLDELCDSLGVEFIDSVESVTADTNEGKALAKLGKGVSHHLQKALTGKVSKTARYRAQLLFLDGSSAFVGLYPLSSSSQWLAGVPRLRLPKQAPSRATLKLEEAWHHFVPAKDWDKRLAPSMRAVDLGAAPGGWTWQLVRRSMFVDAVDNGPMAKELMESGQVTHHVLDGFVYQPYKPVDWLVCDIADKPSRVASMISRWACQRWFTEAVFNLKLPMKQRYQEVMKCRAAISDRLLEQDIPHQLRFKQLYHDREEVTGHLRLF
ncbi:23S rRNA (cytidine(2498)-2'-O)-methyltransferase RlmM [Teredinibacter haidensis]|uniref:23S rRNA (cytidine(2498)-2'-O)-methyltransferase RlmM n=1 Tax=Teredinibacter haidensis TaxID=2731755 RepID=UPI0009F857DC|nr:23S rRNA (cytidine(2498)-2'-O)-methyltransferase RlmM [Teredinibacter haidensis]